MLTEGDPAPDFTLTADSGESVALSSLRGKPVVLYFYPKDDTPGCTAQACGIRDVYGELEQAGAVVLGVSPDDEESHATFKSKYGLLFTLLAFALVVLRPWASCAPRSSDTGLQKARTAGTRTVSIPVEGMSCMVCVSSVKRAAQGIDGVRDA